MNTQPEALRLADEVVAQVFFSREAVAAELRRLYEANQVMLEALKLFVIENKTHTEFERFEVARAAITKGEQQ